MPASDRTIGILYRFDSLYLSVRRQQPCRLGRSLYRRPNLRKLLHFASFSFEEKGKMRNFRKEGSFARPCSGRRAVEQRLAHGVCIQTSRTRKRLAVCPDAGVASCLASPSRADPA